MKPANRLSQKTEVQDVITPQVKDEQDNYHGLLEKKLPQTPQEMEEFLKAHHSDQEGE